MKSDSVICILGMHRSGTSCLAGCLEENGLFLGDVVNSAPYNLKGNKENISLRSINDDVLAYSNGAWDLPPSALVWNDELRDRRDSHVLQYKDYPVWGFKDPRTVLTLPFWLEANLKIKLVGTFRHPILVSRSLDRRPGLKPRTPALELWKNYNRRILTYRAGFKFPLLNFDSPEDQYIENLKLVIQRLGLKKDEGLELGFFDSGLKSNDRSGVEDDQKDEECMSVYNRLLKYSVNSL